MRFIIFTMLLILAVSTGCQVQRPIVEPVEPEAETGDRDLEDWPEYMVEEVGHVENPIYRPEHPVVVAKD